MAGRVPAIFVSGCGKSPRVAWMAAYAAMTLGGSVKLRGQTLPFLNVVAAQAAIPGSGKQVLCFRLARFRYTLLSSGFGDGGNSWRIANGVGGRLRGHDVTLGRACPGHFCFCSFVLAVCVVGTSSSAEHRAAESEAGDPAQDLSKMRKCRAFGTSCAGSPNILASLVVRG